LRALDGRKGSQSYNDPDGVEYDQRSLPGVTFAATSIGAILFKTGKDAG
jgi:hypothetical protein